ncbi:MAG TPA: hypothetical protein VK152_02715 [Paludibacter sp.]|nr:hypothetical protein [Paludibacter sp.]
MKKITCIALIFCSIQIGYAQSVKYSTAWFGPNANPVPEFADARIPAKTTISLMGDYYFGFGDQTKNGYAKIEIPLLPQRISLKIWSSVLEHYKTTPEIMQSRGSNAIEGKESGDLYVQTRIRLLNEQNHFLSVILNSTLKTASAKTYKSRRYFDTPGYYFDLEAAKSFYTKSKVISEIRGVANLGFMCWETTGSLQDDAPMYGGKIILANQNWKLENTLSGYWGWIHTYTPLNPGGDYGDMPVVYAAKFTFITHKIDYFAQYQYGLRDFPYHQIRAGISFQISKLTPKYSNP